MSGQEETKKEVPKPSKSLLRNSDRAKIRKESRKRMKAKMAPEVKELTSTRLDEVLK